MTLGGGYDPAPDTGKLMRNREGLQKAIERACEAKAAIVVYSLSRLSRSTRDTLIEFPFGE